MTPAQLRALVQRKEYLDRRQDSRFGMIVCTILNLFIKKGSKPVGPLQAMGYDDNEVEGSSVQREQSPEETELRFRIMKAGFARMSHKGG